ncbi:hypothetical protein DL98DRAFT_98354 [Cadophora sp. DSE1049]|nr:hypothetical protein DL98DRAFT_98354 [Cadophora sp. DSE1049]
MLSPMQRRKIQSSAAAIQSGYDTLAGWIDGTMSQTTPDGHGDDGSQEPAGFAWSLYHHTLNLFSLLLSPMLEHVATFSSPYDKQSEKSLKKSLGRLFLWGGSFEGGKLESVLDESESLKETVMESLAAIGKILLFSMLDTSQMFDRIQRIRGSKDQARDARPKHLGGKSTHNHGQWL